MGFRTIHLHDESGHRKDTQFVFWRNCRKKVGDIIKNLIQNYHNEKKFVDTCLLLSYNLYINLFALHYIPVLLGCEINSTN